MIESIDNPSIMHTHLPYKLVSLNYTLKRNSVVKVEGHQLRLRGNHYSLVGWVRTMEGGGDQ